MKVREVIKLIEEDGWYLARTRGSHRQFKHPTKSGLVTIAGKPSDDASTWHLKQHNDASSTQGTQGRRRRRVMRYAIVIEKLESNYSAYVPDLPGCVATGATLEEMEQQIKEAIAFHWDGLREEGLPIPEPTTLCEYVETC
ncbi:type II toxin-antitoxin system HicA family toxin [Coleofasciculus sp. LEGE 07092]|nr:type II toxin-antitoxin system HicA family toxin [Coleofasciculus sp. LEGE 07081]MBE9148114.1 type II toxin-antitoxin system HicA family toxin [Coleofasciculus sp. LEGE 07092]